MMKRQEFERLSAGYALHALSSEDNVLLQQAIAAHPEWQSIVDADIEAAAGLAQAVAEVEPNEELRARLLDLVSSTPQDPAHSLGVRAGEAAVDRPSKHQPSAASRRRRRATLAGFFALAASLAVLIAIAIGPQLIGLSGSDDHALTALEQVSQADDAETEIGQVSGGGQATVYWSDELRSAVLVVDGLQTLPAAEDFEVWLVRGETPISAGVLQPGRSTAELPGFQPGDTVAVTVERTGGSASGMPTAEPIVVLTTG